MRLLRPVTLRAAAAALLIAPLIACGPAGEDGEAITIADSSGVRIVMNDLARLTAACTVAPEPTVSIGIDEGEEAYMLAGVFGAVRLSDGRIVLAHRSTSDIRYYDATGRYLYSSGRKGAGPGEFNSPFQLRVLPNDTIYVGDLFPFNFEVFGPDGKWVRGISMDPVEVNNPRSMNVLDDGRLLLGKVRLRGESTGQFVSDSMDVLVYDAAGRFADTLATYANGRFAELKAGSRFFLFPHFESFAQMRARGTRLILGHASVTELKLYQTTAGFPLDGIIRWQQPGLDVTDADLAAELDRIRGSYANAPAQFRETAMPAELDERRNLNRRFPAFGQLHMATDGRIWIREYPRPTDTTAHHWIAFDREGRFDCRLDTPRFEDYLEFGADYLLVRDPDSLGVERVRQFPLRKP